MFLPKDNALFHNNWKLIEDTGFNVIFDYIKNDNNQKPYQMPKQTVLKQYQLIYDILMTRNAEIRKMCICSLDDKLVNFCHSIIENANGNFSLEYFVSKWISYSKILYDWIRKAFKYLDNVKRMINRGATLEEDVFRVFKIEVYDKNKEKLYEEFLKIVENYRQNKEIDINICREYAKFLKIFKENDIIENFLGVSEKYFEDLVSEHQNSTFNIYMSFFITEINKELKFYNEVFPEEIKNVEEKINNVVYYKNSGKSLNLPDGFVYMLNNYENNNKYKNELKFTFDIFNTNENAFSIMNKLFKEFVKNNFKEKIIIPEKFDTINKNLKFKDVILKTNFINLYLAYQRNIVDIITNCFSNNNIMNLVFKEVLADIESSQDNINLTYVLPYFFDMQLSNQNFSVEEKKNEISKALELFHFVPDKENFIETYRVLLAERIFRIYYNENYNIFNVAEEKNIIEMFNKECGNEYAAKLLQILNDYTLNIDDIYNKFRLFINDELLPFEIMTSVNILSSENWPDNINTKKALLPKELEILETKMDKFYHKLYPGRILKYSLLDSIIFLEAKINNITFEIKCTTFQGIILLKFNEINKKNNNIINLNDFKKILNFEDENDFNKALQPLIESNIIILNNEILSLNKNFKATQNQCITFKMITENEIKKKEKQVVDRTYPVDGWIVKTVKQCAPISQQNLVIKVLSSLSSFTIPESFIIKRIESLVEREIIFKNKKDPNLYDYGEQNQEQEQ